MNTQNQSLASSIEVRLANENDADKIAEFTRAIARETEHLELNLTTVKHGVKTALTDPQHGFYVVATDQIQIVGCLMISYEWSDWRNGVQWWLQSVYIDAKYRRKGVFTKLFRFIRTLASTRNNVCGIRLYVEKANNQAIATYEALGLQCTDYLVYEMPLDSSDQSN